MSAEKDKGFTGDLIIPAGVLQDGLMPYAFEGCSGFDGKLVLPKETTKIDRYAFSQCSGLTEVVIPDGVTEIGERAFYRCSGLKDIILPEGVAKIGEYAFSACGSEDGKFSLPNTLTIIGDRAFESVHFTGELVLPANLQQIGSYAFSHSSFTGKLIIPSSLKTVSNFGSINIDTLIVSEGVESISGFSSCSNLKKVELPEGLQSLAGFTSCYSLEELTIPSTVNSVSLRKIDNLMKLTNKSSCEITLSDINDGTWIDEETGEEITVLATGTAVRTDLKAAENFLYTVLDETEKTCQITHYSGTEIINEIPSTLDDYTVTEIKNYAFFECENLGENVTLPQNVTRIGEYAFGTSSISGKLIIPDSVRTLGDSAFSYCKQLKEVVVLAGIEEFGRGGTFLSCSGLERVELIEGTQKICAAMFAYNNSLKEIIIPNTVQIIEQRAFASCPALEELTIPSSVTQIGVWIDKTDKKFLSLKRVCNNSDVEIVLSDLTDEGPWYDEATDEEITVIKNGTAIRKVPVVEEPTTEEETTEEVTQEAAGGEVAEEDDDDDDNDDSQNVSQEQVTSAVNTEVPTTVEEMESQAAQIAQQAAEIPTAAEMVLDLEKAESVDMAAVGISENVVFVDTNGNPADIEAIIIDRTPVTVSTGEIVDKVKDVIEKAVVEAGNVMAKAQVFYYDFTAYVDASRAEKAQISGGEVEIPMNYPEGVSNSQKIVVLHGTKEVEVRKYETYFTFKADGFSPYTVIALDVTDRILPENPTAAAPTKAEQETKTGVNTGDHAPFGMMLFLMTVSAGVTVVCTAKRKRAE